MISAPSRLGGAASDRSSDPSIEAIGPCGTCRDTCRGGVAPARSLAGGACHLPRHVPEWSGGGAATPSAPGGRLDEPESPRHPHGAESPVAQVPPRSGRANRGSDRRARRAGRPGKVWMAAHEGPDEKRRGMGPAHAKVKTDVCCRVCCVLPCACCLAGGRVPFERGLPRAGSKEPPEALSGATAHRGVANPRVRRTAYKQFQNRLFECPRASRTPTTPLRTWTGQSWSPSVESAAWVTASVTQEAVVSATPPPSPRPRASPQGPGGPPPASGGRA